MLLETYLPVAVLLGVALALAGVFLFAARLLGPSRMTPEKALPYESGMTPDQAPQMRFNVHFYRIALLFLVFDIEAAFFYPWAVLFRDLTCSDVLVNGICAASPTAFGILIMGTFLSILILALVYVWRKRALEWV